MELHLLGSATIRREGAAPPFTQPRRLGVLVYLVLARPRGLHARDSVVALFWPEHDQAQGRQALRNVLHSIRRELGESLIVTAGDGLVGVDASRFTCDAVELEADLADGRVAEALARYEGELMEGFHVSNAPGFEHWLAAERQRLRGVLLTAASRHVEALRRRNDLPAALEVAQRMCGLEPENERFLRTLLELLDLMGDRAAAIRAYEVFAQRMRQEYDEEPSPQTAALVARVAPRRSAGEERAYVLYVRGMYLFLRAAHGGDAADFHQSRDCFQQALDRDSGYAPAYAGLSNYHAVGAVRNVLKPFAEHFGKAIELSHRALALDATLAIPHVHFGVKAMYLDSDWDAAGREFEQVVALDPTYAEGRRFRGVYLGVMGRHAEAIAELQEAVRLEPRMPIYRNALADAYMTTGELANAVRELRHALGIDPHYGAARERLIRCFERMERYGDAIAERRSMGNAGLAGAFDRAFEEDGARGYRRVRETELRETIATLEAKLRVDPPENASDLLNPLQLRLALAHAELGDLARARAWEEHACRDQPGRRHWFRARSELRVCRDLRSSATRVES